MVFCYCLFSASFLISAFRRMGDCKGRTIRKLMGGGGGLRAKYKKKIRTRENLIKKNSCTPINAKKYSCKGLKKFTQGI